MSIYTHTLYNYITKLFLNVFIHINMYLLYLINRKYMYMRNKQNLQKMYS